MHLLLVEDDERLARALTRLLEEDRHVVEHAPDGRTGLELATDVTGLDCVILDIGLPDTDGYEVARTLRARRASADAVLIAMTGYGQSDDVARATAAGFDHHLVKPADPDRVVALVEAPRRTPR
jgi:DNA-binding response OmpR family regulator